MTAYEQIKNYTKEEMIDFLYNYARDAIDKFTNFSMPNKNSIEEYLNEEIPGTEK